MLDQSYPHAVPQCVCHRARSLSGDQAEIVDSACDREHPVLRARCLRARSTVVRRPGREVDELPTTPHRRRHRTSVRCSRPRTLQCPDLLRGSGTGAAERVPSRARPAAGPIRRRPLVSHKPLTCDDALWRTSPDPLHPVPKLRTRVRFPSPAPAKSPGQDADRPRRSGPAYRRRRDHRSRRRGTDPRPSPRHRLLQLQAANWPLPSLHHNLNQRGRLIAKPTQDVSGATAGPQWSARVRHPPGRAVTTSTARVPCSLGSSLPIRR